MGQTAEESSQIAVVVVYESTSPNFLHKVHLVLVYSEKVKCEINMYLQYPTLNIDESPLEWWKLECKHMPLLSAVAHKYLYVCVLQECHQRGYLVLVGT